MTSDPTQKRDGQWLAEFLGLDPAFVATVHGSGRPDQKQARAMQTALWPATLGYWMNTLFTPTGGKTSIFSDNIIEETRAVLHPVRQRARPAARDPHRRTALRHSADDGVLAHSVVSASNLLQAFLPTDFLGSLYGMLRQLDADWTTMSQTLRTGSAKAAIHIRRCSNVIAHHPSSVEYYSRNAESLAQLFNMLNFWALAPDLVAGDSFNLGLQAQAVALLQRFGYTGSTELPDLLNHFFLTDNPQITTSH